MTLSKKITFVFFLTFLSFLADGTILSICAQDKIDVVTVSGTVIDKGKNPIVGVAVFADNSGIGVSTDLNGKFNFDVPSDAEVTIQLIGYKIVAFAAKDLDGRTIVLEEDSNYLDDVIVVGYGTRKKENLTGAISSIGGDDKLKTATVTSLAQNLAGKVAGLQIRQENGEPGDFSTSINIRGFGAPLYVIDGIPQMEGSNIFQRLSPNDIENISVIKDALGAVYGRRGANGVVIVTTKKGRSEKTVFSVDISTGFQLPTDMPAMADRSQWAQMYNEAKMYSGVIAFTPEQLAEEMSSPSTDWYGMTMKDFSMQQQYHFSAEGRSKSVSYYIGGGYIKDDGILKTGDLSYSQYSLRANLSAEIVNNLKLDCMVYGTYDSKVSPSLGYHNIFYGLRTALPGAEAYVNGNKDYLAKQEYLNPLAISDSDISGYSKLNDKVLNANLSLGYEFPFVKGLSAKISADYTYHGSMGKTLAKEYNLYSYDAEAEPHYVPISNNSPSRISNSYSNVDMLTLQGQIMYNRTFNDVHSVEATFVYEQSEYHSRVASLAREYSFYTGDQINLASLNNQTNSGIENDITNMSYIGRLSYGYDDRYLVDISCRYDGSCLYAPGKRWGFFPVGSLAWRISEEQFMKHQNIISNLKIRGSYGLVGEDSGLPFQYVQGFSVLGGKGYEFEEGKWTEGASSPMIVNRNLTWFTSTIADVGLDLGFMNDVISISFDVYQRDRHGLLGTRLLSLPNTFGASLPQENLNSDRTLGYDLALSFNHHIDDFYFSISGNFNYARTMNRYIEQASFNSSMERWRNGMAYRWSDVYWGCVYDGQFQNEGEILNAPVYSIYLGNEKILPGDFKYKDMNEDGIIDSNDYVPLFYGGYPKIFYGLTIAFNWKGIDFSMLLQGSGKNTVRFNGVYAEIFAMNLNTPAYFYDRWHRSDPYDDNSEWIPGKWPASRFISDAGAMYNESSIWRRDASYLRLKNISIGYTMPYKWFRKLGVSKAKIYLNANNVFTICDPFVRPFDPEKSEGLDNLGFNYPLMQSYNIGLNIVF